jgi:hypothetical protein
MHCWLQGKPEEHSSMSTHVLPSSFSWNPGQHLHWGKKNEYNQFLSLSLSLIIGYPFSMTQAGKALRTVNGKSFCLPAINLNKNHIYYIKFKSTLPNIFAWSSGVGKIRS